MIRMLINIRTVFYLWVLANLGLLLVSGYLHKIALALTLKNMSDFIEVHKHIYPYDTNNIRYYDISEFLLSYLVPLAFMGIFRRFKASGTKYRSVL